MRILHVAAEIAPIAKVGGLADVVYGLARAQIRAGHQVAVLLPLYGSINLKLTKKTVFKSEFNGRKFRNTLWQGVLDGIPLLFIEPHHPKKWFKRGEIYEKKDLFDRFLYFSRAAYDYLRLEKTQPDVLHLHDWHTSALAMLVDEKMLFAPKLVITIHNFFHQGKCPRSSLKRIGLPFRNEYLDSATPSKVNLLRGAIIACDKITTVSPTYAKEVLTPQFGYGLEQILLEYQDKFSGILNGIHYDYWNPKTDPFLAKHYASTTLKRRARLKHHLRETLGLDQADRPLVAAVARLDPQKGVKFLEKAIQAVPRMEGQLVLLGTSPIPAIQKQFLALQKKYKDHPHVRLIISYDEELAHQIYAGSDILLVPSLFEPCGLTQLIALRYGAVPLVRKTGGLADTVFDVDDSREPHSKRNGYSFKKPTIKSFIETLERAFNLWYKHPRRWEKLQKHGMLQDFSWNSAARHYLNIYD